jgi:hypothetical protein
MLRSSQRSKNEVVEFKEEEEEEEEKRRRRLGFEV